ncbi:condensation domain-containing protein [Crocosphaera sp.]|uniref:condensation domain-containing protein n=1 Tax=Crocosphaera sp. TaxID=2729996 RepID=UPI003F21DCF9|nr:condensation domain-containing protein [Crocosphaera sp.]
MTLNELLGELSQRKIKLHLEGEQLGIRAPKGALNAALKQSLKEYKQDIILFLKQQDVIKKELPPLVKVDKEQPLCLSLAQERLFKLEDMNSKSAVYNLSVAFRFTGSLNIVILEKSISEIVKRHEVLRSYFKSIDNQPVVIIDEQVNYQLPIQDVSKLSSQQREREVELITRNQVQKPFNLTKDYLWRSQLICVQEQEHIFVLTMHHLISDGWSFGLFLRELSEIYQALSLEKQAYLPSLSVQYVDFAQWQRHYLNSDLVQSSRDYWQQQLSQELHPLKLPVDKQSSFVASYEGGYELFKLSKGLIEGLKSLSQQEGVSLFTTLLTIFAILLNRYTEQEKLLICSPVLNRNPSEIENLIGYFNNILPLVINLEGNPTFRELLPRVRQVTTDAYEHQDIPLQQLAELPGIRNIPLTRAMFNLDKLDSETLTLPGVEVDSIDVNNGAANFDLSVTLFEQQDNTIKGILNYKVDLFSASIISQIVAGFQTLLETLVDTPDARVDSLEKQSTPEIFTAETAKKEPLVAPRDDLETELVALWEDILEIHPIGIRDNFFLIGGHSVLALRLFAEIEKRYSRNLGLATLFSAPTIEDLANILRSEEDISDWSSLVPIQPHGSHPPLFCFHAVGGNALTYVDLSYYLGKEQPLYGLQARGLDGKTPFDTSIEEMASHYLEEILKLDFQGPYLLAGLSGGGVIAFEVAQQLQAKGKQVALIALFDSYNPKYIRERTIADKQYRKRHNQDLKVIASPKTTKSGVGKLNRGLLPFKTFLQKLSSSGFSEWKLPWIANKVSSLFRKLIRFTEVLIYQLNPQTDKPLPYNFRTKLITENMKKAVKSYVPRKYDGKIHLFRADGSIYQSEEGPDSDELGWDEFATGGLEICPVPGDHNTMLSTPNVEILASKLKVVLDDLSSSDVPYTHISRV